MIPWYRHNDCPSWTTRATRTAIATQSPNSCHAAFTAVSSCANIAQAGHAIATFLPRSSISTASPRATGPSLAALTTPGNVVVGPQIAISYEIIELVAGRFSLASWPSGSCRGTRGAISSS